MNEPDSKHLALGVYLLTYTAEAGDHLAEQVANLCLFDFKDVVQDDARVLCSVYPFLFSLLGCRVPSASDNFFLK